MILLLATAVPAVAGDWEATGYFGLDSRIFPNEGLYPEQENGFELSIMAQPEFYWRSDGGQQRISLVGFARADSQDANRTHADLREAFWGFEADTFDSVIGFNRVFWGVAESRHLVDVINQTDLVEDIDQEEKLGQPMLNFNVQRDYGRFGLFIMPWFRERTFPGPEGRFRGPLPVDVDHPEYESSAGRHHVDLALRYSHYFGDVDIGASVFKGTSREPRFELAQEGDRLIPVYDQMVQAGLDLQYTQESWLWKLEAILRDTQQDTFMAAVGGLEYTLFGLNETALDLGLLAEYLYDGRGPGSPPTSFDNDLFLGTRLAFNDAYDTSILAGFIMDLDSREMLFNLEAERRLGDSFSLEIRLRAFAKTVPDSPLYSFRNDDYLQLRLNWHY